MHKVIYNDILEEDKKEHHEEDIDCRRRFGIRNNDTDLAQKERIRCRKGNIRSAAIKAMGAGDAFHLVLSDLRLPDHDGLVLLQHIRKSDAHLPFIVMTSYAEVQNAVCAMKSGATDYVAKPFHPEILLEKIREAIQSAASAVSAPQPAESAAMQDAPQEEQQARRCLDI